MKMSANRREEVKFKKGRQDVVSVERPHRDISSQWKMGENDCRLARVKSRQILPQPGKGFRRDLGIPPGIPGGRIDADQLPTAVFDNVVDLVFEYFLIRAAVGVRQVIMIADGSMQGKTEPAKAVRTP